MTQTVPFPFAPRWEELQKTVKTQHAPCYFFAADDKGLSREEKARVDTALVKAYQEACRMHRLAEAVAKPD